MVKEGRKEGRQNATYSRADLYVNACALVVTCKAVKMIALTSPLKP